IGVVYRLLDLGVEPFLVASAVIGVIAQRMTRQTCPDCAQLGEIPALEQLAYSKETGDDRTDFLIGSGCKSCANTGYQGRTGIFEILRMSDEIRMMLLDGASALQLRDQAIKGGMAPLIKDGMLKAQTHITTPAEILRNAYSIE
ncbi:type II/IV secretion system protein, partial [Chloroflexota bacterium]